MPLWLSPFGITVLTPETPSPHKFNHIVFSLLCLFLPNVHSWQLQSVPNVIISWSLRQSLSLRVDSLASSLLLLWLRCEVPLTMLFSLSEAQSGRTWGMGGHLCLGEDEGCSLLVSPIVQSSTGVVIFHTN